jgi:hypothetical protein
MTPFELPNVVALMVMEWERMTGRMAHEDATHKVVHSSLPIKNRPCVLKRRSPYYSLSLPTDLKCNAGAICF